MALNYNAPQVGVGTNLSTIDDVLVDGKKSNQMRSFEWLRKSIITARKEQFFHQLADVTTMPKHMGKTIKVYEYVPLLDDRNNNTMGLEISAGVYESGNLYGSSKDIGTITGRLPNLTENGGRVNRVGFTRIQREGAIKKYGFFTDFTQEALDFDSDDQLMDHLSRELVNGAVQVSEALLQMDLLDAASVVVYPGDEDDDSDMGVTIDSGAVVGESTVTYEKIMKLDQILTDNRTPRDTQIITGSRFIDTRTLPAGRVMYVGSEVVPLLRNLTDSFGNKVFIEANHYAAATTLLVGEIGAIGPFRIVQVPEMLHWAGTAGDGSTIPQVGKKIEDATDDYGFRVTEEGTDAYFNVYPMLVVGSKSFTAIGFQTNGKVLNLTAMTKMPGMATMGHNDPYGAKGLSSLQWYQGTLILRPERIGLIKTLAPL